MPIPTQSEYEAHEAKMHFARVSEIENAPLQERKQGLADFTDALLHPEYLAERVHWLLNGDYGFGSRQVARRVLESRGNRIAGIAQLIACMEWYCPARFAAKAYKSLSGDQQKLANDAIQAEIEEYEAEKATA